MPNLIVERGREKGTSFDLKPDAPCVAGRDPETVQIVISDPASSRRHFQVAARAGKWYVTDLGSRNHTFLNEEKIEKERELASGDLIQVGETVLSFLDDDKAEDKAAAQGMNGKEIGGYKILDRLGRGGMGTVFKAKQISLNRVIALKVLSSKFAKDPKFIERFISEARAAGQLNHPNVVQVFDVGQLGGLHFFSMELMEGGCVQDLLSAAPDGRLTWQVAMPLIVDASRGLVFAEKRGIIHRDIKPDNLMLTSEQRVKIGDLGLAMKAEGGAGDKQIFGTPHFIAPEQAQGKEVTHAADLYALGATFYRMVTGKTPFSGDTVKEILKKQINDPHQPIGEVVKDFPEDLAAIVDKLMAKKVENRYQSATKLVEDLEAFQLAHQIELSGARKMNKPLLIAALVGGLAAAGVAIFYATRPKEKEYIPGKDTETTVVVREPGKTPEEERQIIESRAKDAYYAIKDKDPRDVTLEKEADLLKLADEYESLAAKHADPRAASAIQPGLARAREIRESLQRQKDEKAAVEDAARAWWSDFKTKLDAAEQSKNWAEAIRLSEKWAKDPNAQKHMKVVPAARDELPKIEAREVTLAEQDFEATKLRADEAQKAGDMEKAMQEVNSWADALEAGKPANDKLKGFVLDARNWVADRKEAFVVSLSAQLDQDRLAYVDAIRALRPAGTGPMYDFQFDAAASQLEAAAAALRTYPYQARAARHVERLRGIQRAFTAWVQLLAEGKLFSAGEDVKGLPGATPGVSYKVNLEDKPTLEHFTVDTVLGAGKGRKSINWADFTREEMASILVLPKADKLPGDVATGFAWMFVELGHGPAAQAMLDRAITSGAAIAPADEASLRREINVINAYEDLRKKAGSDPNEIVLAVVSWRGSAAGTDTYVFLDGRPGKDLQVLTQAETDEFLTRLGKKPQ